MVPWSEVNLPISRVAGGGKLMRPPSHLDLVLPERSPEKPINSKECRIYSENITQESKCQVVVLTGLMGKQIATFGKALDSSGIKGFVHVDVCIHEKTTSLLAKRNICFWSLPSFRNQLVAKHVWPHICCLVTFRFEKLLLNSNTCGLKGAQIKKKGNFGSLCFSMV